MAAHNGHLVSSKKGKLTRLITGDSDFLIVESLSGETFAGSPAISTEVFAGFAPKSVWNLIAQEKIYLDPVEVDAGLIGNDLEFTIAFWNASEETITLDSIDQSNSEGFTLSMPIPPVTMTGESLYTYILTVLADGPATQSTTFTFTFSNGEVRVFGLSGRRLEVFPFECDAKIPVEISLKFETIIATSEKFIEQRRSITPEPFKKMTAGFWFEPVKTQQFLFLMRSISNRILAVPVYSEELKIINDPQGGDIIEIDCYAGMLDNCWFLAESTYILLLNTEDATVYELLTIEDIYSAANSITITSYVSQSFNPATSSAFPVLISFWPEIAGQHLTPEIVEYKLTFEEYKQ